jgi:hypothetical protein
MEDVSRFIPMRTARPLRGMPGFGTLAHSPGAMAVGPLIVAATPDP